MPKLSLDVDKYLRTQVLPTVCCPGCRNGNTVEGLATAFSRMNIDPRKVVVVSGISCSGRTPFYVNSNAMHTTHGRALVYANGLKMAQPELMVAVTMGDGDTLAIGGNHFIHTARRNIDLTVLVYNNGISGMTGGQVAPTTPMGSGTTTSLLGSIDRTFDTVDLALAVGATYVARTTTFDMQEIPLRIQEAIAYPGFAVVGIIGQCPTYYGRLNQLGDATDMLIWERDRTDGVPAKMLKKEELLGPLGTGVFRTERTTEFTEAYKNRCARSGASYGHS
ncbi:MAG: thiamine pyrophosphate-dependent enzyme [Actinomycetota bacterium]|nr:thiamine pyrophosphate-dependent enzyme [Actinomycetota bacterium]